ncbi:Highly reducing polyketide synthase alt5 [Mytilus edulis]|uniref:Highly reducing polyketide synthase alt5 n=1 Tax=Mytilus edulis TaxID=6550 RepID=A0A8S3UVE3_MYTED|nr:Highly reducing polyketide synthase alt5 [Mytilus edulis]
MEGDEAVAVVGIGCRFPGANNIDEFWNLLEKGENHIKEVPKHRWNVDEIDYTGTDDSWKNSAKYAGLIDDFDKWDNKFFGIGDTEAGWINPQTALTLEVTHSALENGGLTLQNLKGSNTGVYIGVTNNDMMCGASRCRDESNISMLTGIASSLTANRISHFYDLRGPSMVVDTACSSSLTAVHMACQAIRTGECSMAICGGVNSILSPGIFIVLGQAKMISHSGKSHPFADDAEGYAKRDGDNIWGTIVCGCNQNGKTSSPITAPSSTQQRVLLDDVYRRFKVDPSIIQYVEAHGTGTPVGDPIEMTALSEFYGQYFSKTQTVSMGSVKSNIGHLESAAGIAGLIKTLLMMRHGKIVPSLHYKEGKGNSSIDFENNALKVATSTIPWPVRPDGSRYGSINSFGFGGSNAHAIVKTVSSQPDVQRPDPVIDFDHFVIAISGTSIPAVMKTFEHMQSKIATTSYNVRDLSYTSLLKREHFSHRIAFISKTEDDLRREIVEKESNLLNILPSKSNELNMIFFFGGVGTVWNGTCQKMLDKDTPFRRTFIKIDEELHKYTNFSIIDHIRNPTENFLMDSFKGPLVIFACQVSLFHLWRSLGITPNIIVGQSVGEVAAAHAAGVFSLGDAVKVIFHRSALSSKANGGQMMVVGKCDISEIEEKCLKYNGKLSIAVYSSKEACVISGDKEAIEDIQEDLKRAMPNILMKILDVNCAYHSYHMDDASAELPKYLDGLKPMTPEYEIISTVTGEKIDSSSMVNPMYWAKNLRQPVYLSKAVSNSTKENKLNIVLELGPKPVVKAHIRSITKSKAVCIPSLNQPDEIRTFVEALARLFEYGSDIQFEQFFHGYESLTDIPQYNFNRCDVLLSSETLKSKLRALKEHTDRHPFVTHNRTTNNFIIQLSPSITPYVYQHAVEKTYIAPGSVHTEIGLEIARRILHLQTSEIEISLRFVNRLRMDKNRTEELTTQADEFDSSTFKIRSNEKTVCKFEMKRATRSSPCTININQMKAKLDMFMTGNEFYSNLKEFGFEYGEDLSMIKDCWRFENQYLVTMEVPARYIDPQFISSLVPVVLDGAFQTTILSFDPNTLDKTRDISMPVRIQSLIVHKQPGKRVYVLGQLEKTNKFGSTMDMLVINENGEVAIELIGCELQNTAPTLPDNPLKNKFYEIRWQPVIVDREYMHDNVSKTLSITFEANVQRFVEKYLPESKHIIISSSFHCDIVWKELHDYVIATFGSFRNISEIVYCPVRTDVSPNNISSRDIFEKVKFSCVMLTKLCQKLIHDRLDIPMYILTKRTQPKASMQDNQTFDIIGSELWGMVRCLILEKVLTKLCLVDFEEECDLVCLLEVIKNQHKEQISIFQELKFEGKCIYSNTLMRSTIDEPPFRMNTYNKFDVLELKSEKCNCIHRPFFAHSHLSQVPEGFIDLKVVSTYSEPIWFPTILTEIIGDDDPWKTHRRDGHHILAAEICGNKVHTRSTREQLYLNEPPNPNPHEEFVTCYPGHASNFAVVPEDCILEKCLLPNYQPGLLLHISLFFALSDEIPKQKPIAIFRDEKVSNSPLLEYILGYKGAGSVSSISISNLSEPRLSKVTPALQIIFLSSNVDKLKTVLTENILVPVQLFSFTNLVSRSNERLLRHICPSLSLKLINNEEVLQRRNLSKTICEIKSWLCSDNAAALQNIPMSFENGRTFFFDDKATYDVNSVSHLQIAATTNTMFGKHSSYIVVGGLTGLGEEIVKLICELGGGVIIIFGRRLPTDEHNAEMQKLTNKWDCKIEFLQTDITDMLSLKKGFDTIRITYPNHPIKGVFHGAAVLDDSTILNMTEGKFEKVLLPKVLGTWNLHLLTKDIDLDYFVLHSSTASVLGGVGQSNYGAGNSFMDTLSYYRRSTGLAGQTINWGPLQLGLMKLNNDLERVLGSQGVNSLTKHEIRECFKHILVKNTKQAICTDIDWKTVVQKTGDKATTSRILPILRELRLLDIFADTSQLKTILVDTDDLLKLPPIKQFQEIIRLTSVIAADVFAVDLSVLTPNTMLGSIGMDSMKGLEFSNSINSRIHIRLPFVSVIAQSATIQSISNSILEHLQMDNKAHQIPVDKMLELRAEIENLRTPLTEIEKMYLDPITDIKHLDAFIEIKFQLEKNLMPTNVLIAGLEQLEKVCPSLLSEYFIDSGETYRIIHKEKMLQILESHEAKYSELNLEFYRQQRDFELLSCGKFDLKGNDEGIHKKGQVEKMYETTLLFAYMSVQKDEKFLNLRFRRFYFDFTSIGIVVNEYFTIMKNNILKESNEFRPLQYTQPGVIDRRLCKTDCKMKYWRSKLGINYRPISLSNFDQAQSNGKSMIIRRFELKGDIIQHFKKWTLKNNASMRDLFLTAYQLLLNFISKSGAPSVVTNVTLREEDDSKQYEGPLETLIPIIANVDKKDKSVQEFVLENLKEIKLVTTKNLISHNVLKSLTTDRKSLTSLFVHAVLFDKDLSQELTSSKLGISPVQVVSMDTRFGTSIHIISDCKKEINWLEIQVHPGFADEATALAILNNLLELANTIVNNQSLSLLQLYEIFSMKIEKDQHLQNLRMSTKTDQLQDIDVDRKQKSVHKGIYNCKIIQFTDNDMGVGL